eukprot:265627-Hanusia_phi.AAC.2
MGQRRSLPWRARPDARSRDRLKGSTHLLEHHGSGTGESLVPVLLRVTTGVQEPAPFDDWDLGNQAAPLDRTYDPNLWENPRQPLTDYNMGKISCNMGSDCHDGTHHGRVRRTRRMRVKGNHNWMNEEEMTGGQCVCSCSGWFLGVIRRTIG